MVTRPRESSRPQPSPTFSTASLANAMNSYRTHLEHLLDRGAKESEVQDFFERNPVLVAGADYLFGQAVITKLPLGNDFVTDFAYINPQSGPKYLRLIEIEDPSKKIFRKDDRFTEKFAHALQQIDDWLGWCSQNRADLFHLFTPLYNAHNQSFPFLVPRALLIYGRRSEINNTRRQERWNALKQKHLFADIRTYDGFMEYRHGLMNVEVGTSFQIDCLTYGNRTFERKFIGQSGGAGDAA